MNLTRIAKAFSVLLTVLAIIASPLDAKGKGRGKGRGGDDRDGGGRGGDERTRESVNWKDVPLAVRATIEENVTGGKLVDVEREARRGTVTYSAVVKLSKELLKEIEVSPAGKLLSITTEAPDADEKLSDKDIREEKVSSPPPPA